MRTARGAWIGACLAAAACRGPVAPEVLVDLRTAVGTVSGVSTEAGILTLDEALGDATVVPFDYRVGRGAFEDEATVQARHELLALLQPRSSRLQEMRFAAWPAERGDRLFVEYRADTRSTVLAPVRLLEDGESGELITPSMVGPIAQLARQLAGAGLFAWRDGHLQLVGILNGVYAESPRALAFIGLEEICRTLPQALPYLERPTLPRRADFEYGVPRDRTRERPADRGEPDREPPPQDTAEHR